jgi:Oxaloacetate decarboxylase, gamma chain.
MKVIKSFIVSAFLLSALTPLCAQNLTDLRVSEAVVQNETGLVDSFGERNGWFELFNTSSGTVKFGGCYLTDDIKNLKKYHIPTTDKSTFAGPRQSVVFYASGKAFQGSFHTNFTLEKGETIYLVSNDGKTIPDQLEIPATLAADQSVVKVPVGVKKIDSETQISSRPTPGSYNGDVDAKTNSEIMKEKDPHGWVLTLISVSVVFCALFILSIIFNLVGYFSRKASEKSSKPAKAGEMTPEVAAAISMALQQELGGEVHAAIALALHSYLNDTVHDAESFILTIKPSGRVSVNGLPKPRISGRCQSSEDSTGKTNIE